MFGIDSSEFLVIVIIAVIVIGPKDLPRALYKVGQIVGKAQSMARHFRTGIDAMVREVEMEELEKKWAEQNKRIMAEHPSEPAADAAALPAPSQEASSSTDVVAQPAPPLSAPPASSDHPPYVAEAAAPPPAADKPPYVAESAASRPKDDTAA